MKTTQNKPISLSRRLIRTLVFTITIIMLVVAGSFYIYASAELEQYFSDDVEENLSYLDGTLGRLLWNHDNITIANVAETVSRDELVVGVTIWNERMETVYSIGEQGGDDVLILTRPIHFEGFLVGELELVFSRDLLTDTLTGILMISLSVWLMVVLSVGVLTELFIRKFFHGPLKSFTDLAESYRRNPESPPMNAIAFVEFQPIEDVVKKLANDVFLQLQQLDDHRRHLEAKVAERTQDLLASEERLKQAQDIAHLGQWDMDLRTDVLHWSDEVFRIFEIDQSKFGASYEAFLETVHPNDRETVDRVYTRSLDRKGPYDIVHQLQMNDGRIKFVREIGETEFDSAGNPVRSLGVVQDITPLKKAEEKLRKANERLKELDQLKSMFIASMSHELRTPLNSIIGLSGVMLQRLFGDLNERQEDGLQRILRSGTHLLDLISDVIDISKIEAGRIDTFPEDVSLQEVVNEAVETVQSDADKKGLFVKVDAGTFPIIETDRKRLFQCLLNLLSNAVKFTEEGGVKVTCDDLADSMRIAVKDTGIGIPDEDAPRLFEAFERLDTHLRVKAGGSGLGLYLTRKITTEILGGEISFESRPGHGSTFVLHIPKSWSRENAELLKGEQ